MGDSAVDPTSDPRVDRRAEALLPEEEAAGTDDAAAQAEAVLAESDAREAPSREATPDDQLETRTSEEATAPPS